MLVAKITMNDRTQTAVFGGGCFWCTEAVFERLDGVISVMPGYAGGTLKNPTYRQVCTGKTGHAEVVQVEYDPTRVPYRNLLTVFFADDMIPPVSIVRAPTWAPTQALYAFSVGVATALITLASGGLYDQFGARAFLLMALLCAVALPLALRLRYGGAPR